jgi:diketogulonate reductase-like aldo/keto reductase
MHIKAALNPGSRSIGVSNFSLEQLQRIVKTARDKPVVNQVRLGSVFRGRKRLSA